MPTKVFISWSGDSSKKIGETICNWLPSVLQNVQPYFTPNDIQKGAKWNSEISQELESSNIGIICLTNENKEKPWIMFEAGALAKKLDKSKVCALLFDMTNADLSGPLTQFQSTLFEKEEVKKLLHSINESSGASGKVASEILNNTFEMCWPMLEKEIATIGSSIEEHQSIPVREEREIIEELLSLVRDMHSGKVNTTPAEEKEKIKTQEQAIEDLTEKYKQSLKAQIVLLEKYSDHQDQYTLTLKEHKNALSILASIKSAEDANEIVNTIKSAESIGHLIKPNNEINQTEDTAAT